MGQPQSVHRSSTAVAVDGGIPPAFHDEQLKYLRTQLVNFAAAIAASAEDVTSAGALPLSLSKLTAAASSRSDAAAFKRIALAGYQLGDALLLEPSVLPSTGAALPSFIALLPRHTQLSVLDLSFNNLTGRFVVPLMEGMAKLPQLTVLRLSGNPLGTAASVVEEQKGDGWSETTQERDDNEVEDRTEHNDDGDGLFIQGKYVEGGADMSEHITPAKRKKKMGGLPRKPDLAVAAAAAAAAANAGEEPRTPMDALGRWLLTNPPLQHLEMCRCALTDKDVLSILCGLVPPPSARGENRTLDPSTKANNNFEYAIDETVVAAETEEGKEKEEPASESHLRILRLSGNLGCTSRTAYMLAELVTDLDNTTLREVELQGVAPDTAKRLEYGCDAEGYFRSGARGIASMDEATAGAEESVKDMSPAQVARFRSRRRFLKRELDGMELMPTSTMAAVHATLSCRRRASASRAENASLALKNKNNAAENAGQKGRKDGARDRPYDAALEEGLLGNQSGECATYRGATTRRGGSTSRHPLETPEHLATVMANAMDFRDRLHPAEMDTYAPPCFEASRLRGLNHTTDPRGTATRARQRAVPWYTKAGYVLRTNGLMKVLVAPPLSTVFEGQEMSGNVDLDGVQDHALRPCWCTPADSSDAAAYGGRLHYHCVREGETAPPRGQGAGAPGALPQVSASRQTQNNGSTKKSKKTGNTTPQVNFAEKVVMMHGDLLPLLMDTTGGNGRGGGGAAEQRYDEAPMYRACYGTGHACLSECVATTDDRMSSRSWRMQTLLRSRTAQITMASTRAHGATSTYNNNNNTAVTGGIRPLRPQTGDTMSVMSGQTWDEYEDPDATQLQKLSKLYGKTATVYTTSGGLSVALNYNPVSYFSAPYEPCAAGMEVDERS